MSGIDWSKAPEGATHAKQAPGVVYWLKEHDGTWWWRVDNSKYWSMYIPDDAEFPHYIPRPSPAWNGEGLPPVGVKCEVNDARSDNWREVDEVIAHASLSDRDVAVFRIGDYIAYSPADRFRPIRTPEQIAANEREAAIDAMCAEIVEYYGSPKMSEHYLGLAKALHVAGYRKQADK